MYLVPWRKRGEIAHQNQGWQTLEDEFNRFFDSALSSWVDANGGSYKGGWTPAIDVVEKKDAVEVRADLPGLNKEDIHVSVDEGVLTIKGEKKTEKEEKSDGYLRTERTYGSFYRAINLPGNVDSKKIKANYKNGVLDLTLPKKEESKPKQIDVEVS